MASPNRERPPPGNPFHLDTVATSGSSSSKSLFTSTTSPSFCHPASSAAAAIAPTSSSGQSISSVLTSNTTPSPLFQNTAPQEPFSFGKVPSSLKYFDNVTVQHSGESFTSHRGYGEGSTYMKTKDSSAMASFGDVKSSSVFGSSLGKFTPSSSFTSSPSLFGGTFSSKPEGKEQQQVTKAETEPLPSYVSSRAEIEGDAAITSVPLSAANLFGGSVSNSIENQTKITTSANIFGGGGVVSSSVKVFGGGSNKFLSAPFGGSTASPPIAQTSSPEKSSLFPKHGGLAGSKESFASVNKVPSSSISSSGNIFGGASTETHSYSSTKQKAHTSLFTDVKFHTVQPADFAKPEQESMAKNTRRSSNVSRRLSLSGREESQEFDSCKKNCTQIFVTGIPGACLDKEILRNHFAKFGEVKRVTPKFDTNQATIQFTDHKGASIAKKKGKKIHPKLDEVKIFYKLPVRRRSEETANSVAMISKKKAIKTLQPTMHASDLDPYTPLPRPDSEEAVQSPVKPRMFGPAITLEEPCEGSSKGMRSPSKYANMGRSDDAKSPGKLVSAKTATSERSILHKLSSKSPITKKHFTKDIKVPDSYSAKSSSGKKQAKVKVKEEESRLSSDEADPNNIIRSQAQSNNEKYLILKARDSLLRKDRNRTSDIEKATFLSATCPDMCPEFERYMRDIQNDLSTYETTNGVLDHRLAVKKFSRSSADKDLPLPHELRPGPVLLRTMDFLICNVIQLIEDEVEVDVWYNYLWNRTRAIRNDLMQQHLTDATAVVIMERCTRFHIYAAARLCEEPSDLYDAKMNTEHLTKSLQTLKELYHDLGEKGQYFESEAEFRAYEMLLNLNDGETIVTQYSQFRENVQKSSHVQFALKLILAVTFNNYAKFFKLIQTSTYLQGCLLHRYFRQIRSTALDIILRAYVPSKVSQTIPLQTIVNMLGFEDEMEAVMFLQCHGISIVDKNMVPDRGSFINNPEEYPPQTRPHRLVECKKTCSVGEIVQGGPMPENPLHTHIPHDSFDGDGYLKHEAREALDQQREKCEKKQVRERVTMIQPPGIQQNYELLSHMKIIYETVESSVLGEVLRKVTYEVLEECQEELRIEEVVQAICQKLFEESIQREIKIVVQDAYDVIEKEIQEALRKQREEEEKRKKAVEELHRKVSGEILVDFITEFVPDFVRLMCKEAYEEETVAVAMHELSEELPVMCINEVTSEEINKITQAVIKDASEKLEANIKQLQQKIIIRQIAEYFKMWRNFTLKARWRKQSQEMFPAGCSQLSVMQQNEGFGWGYQRSGKENMSVLSLLNLASSTTKTVEKVAMRNLLIKEYAWHPLPLLDAAKQEVQSFNLQITEHNILSQFYKVLVCVEDFSNPCKLVLWLRSKLAGEGERSISQSLMHSFSFVCKKTGVRYAWVIRESSANDLSNEVVRGTALVLFITSGKSTKKPQYIKVRKLLTQSPEVCFKEIHYDSNAETHGAWCISEEDLLKPETSEKLLSVIIESWRKQVKDFQVITSRFNNFVLNCVTEHFLEPVLRKQNERHEDHKSPIPPSVLIECYNKLIDFLVKIVDDIEIKKLNWPPPELFHTPQVPPPSWNTEDIRQNILMLSLLKLPDITLKGCMLWPNVVEWLQHYALQVSRPHGDGTTLLSTVTSLLSSTRKVLSLGFGVDEGDCKEWELHVLQLPWVELVHACVAYKMIGLSTSVVYYQPAKVDMFKLPASWWAACDSSDRGWAEAVEKASVGLRKRKAETQEELQQGRDKVKKAPSQLLLDLEEEKEKSANFLKELESLLHVDEELMHLFEHEN